VEVSIQLVSPASGDPDQGKSEASGARVSIQLVSPASGDFIILDPYCHIGYGFHSISFPSEWGLADALRGANVQYGFHSISFPSEWGPRGYIC